MTDQTKPSDKDSTKKKELGDEENDSDNPPASPNAKRWLAVYLIVFSVIAVSAMYRMWPVCDPKCEPSPPPAESKTAGGQQPEAPFLTPNSGPIQGQTPVRITWKDFVDKMTTVTFDTVPAEVKFESSTSVLVEKAPAHAAGAVTVVVKRKPDDAGATLSYTYAAPLSVTTVSPNSGTVNGGTTVNIIGTGFTKDAKVSFGGVQSVGVSVDSTTSITARLPCHAAGKVDVLVANGDGQSVIKGDSFTYVCPGQPEYLVILMILFAGALGGCLHAMRSLADFVGARQLKQSWILYYLLLPLTSAVMAFIFYLIVRAGFFAPDSQTTDKAAVMLGLAALVGLFSEAAMEKLKKIGEAVFTSPPPRPDPRVTPVGPTITGVDPKSGPAAKPVTIKGTGFDVKAVQFGDVDATVTKATATAISVTTPPHDLGPVDVVVTNKDGKTATLKAGFKYEAQPGE